MRKFGLIGYPLTHSFSEKYFSEKFRNEKITGCTYQNFPLENIAQFPALLNTEPDLTGLNVTIPYKESVIQYLDEIDEEAKEIGAVNTIYLTPYPPLLQERGKKGVRSVGYNTDAFGFEKSFKKLLEKHHQKALVLGSGGGAKAVCFVLKKLRIEFLIVSRNKNLQGFQNLGGLTYKDLNEQIICEYNIIINTTPLGMRPQINDYPQIPYQFLSEEHLLYDLIYNPGETLFLKKGKEQGAKTKNGLEMLQLQAEKSWEIWNSTNL